ncbi:MAG TPA: DUF507 family protein [Dissulfurispiraceae bacterium]|nr:DUF507 family protein [Dissulfurispiraceae bacterium]
MLSDDKITHLTHVLLNGLIERGVIRLKADDSILRREIKRTILNELKIGEDMDLAVKKKLQSLSKRPVEGSQEWDVMYRKYFEEEEVRRGRK